MTFLSLLEQRRSIRKFLDQKVEAEKIGALIEAALRSPSSMGNDPWEFVVVEDKAVLEKLARAKPHGATFMKNAPLGIVVCADPDKSTVWIEDASIASILIHLAAQSMGLGSCWIQIRGRMHDDSKTAEAYIADILGIPEKMKILSIIAVGYPAEKKSPHAKSDLKYEKVHAGSYGHPHRG
jgi:nitroreductase